MTKLNKKRPGLAHLINILPDKRMSEMPEPDVFNMIDVDHLTDGSRIDDFSDLQARRKVSEDVTNGHKNSGLIASRGNLFAI